MSATPPSVVEYVRLGRLRPPETDVRQSRDRDQVRSIAESMERSGQLQAAKVYPPAEVLEDYPDDLDEQDLRKIAASECDLVVEDGWTRREAARINNWKQLRVELFADASDDTIVAQLEANTERIDMADYETMQALKSWSDETGKTQAEVAETIGKARSTVSNWFRALDAPEYLTTRWQDPDTHIEYGHVREILQLPTEDLQRKVLEDCMQYDRSVTMTRETAKNTVKAWKRNQQDDRTKEEREADGQARRAERKAKQEVDRQEDRPDCVLCGAAGDTTIALPVCREDYGLLTRKKETGEPLLGEVATDESSPTSPDA
jgi:ParB/RepB/Spo0J family partition protein